MQLIIIKLYKSIAIEHQAWWPTNAYFKQETELKKERKLNDLNETKQFFNAMTNFWNYKI